jgi:PAS domain S-box-containing protein
MRIELDSIYRSAPVGLGVLDTRLRFLQVNARFAEMNGASIEAHIGRTVHEIVPDLGPQAEALLQRVLETGEPIRDLEVRGETPAQPGVERVWREQIVPLRDEAGQITRISVVAEEITEQRRSEEALKRSQANLALAMEAAGLALWECRTDVGEIRLGDHWDQLLGLPAKESVMSRDAWLDLVHPDDRALASECGESPLADASDRLECEYRVRHASGRWVRLKILGRAVESGPDGRPIRSVGVARDITAERDASQSLLERAQLLHLAFDAVFTWSEEGGIDTWNQGAALQYGYAAEEARGVHPNVLLDTGFPVGVEDVRRVLASEGVWRGELSHRTRDGRRLAVSAVMQHVPGQRGRVLEITRDMTAAKENEARLVESERELRLSQERLRVALEAGRMGAWEWIPSSQRIAWSPEVRKLLGLTETGEAPGADRFLAMLHPEDRARFDAEIARVLAKGGDYETEFRVRRADGETRWLVSRGRVMRDGDEDRSRIVGVHVDITERKLIEEALREVDSRRTEFLAMLAHELRNPLAPIANAVRLLEVVVDDPERRDAAVQILRRQTTQMARLVDDLMEASRITRGRIELRVENILVATPVLQAVEAARPHARERGQTIHVDVPTDLDLVADSTRLTQIVSNLVINAVKYTQEGGLIEVRAEADGDERVSIIVKDNGPGISPELQSRIFDLFTQDARTLDRAAGGLGIGLALVKRLTELHGGTVRCESVGPGEGARFVVCLPRHGRREELRGSPVTATSAHLPPLPILVVDDNRDAADSLAALLRLDGHRVEVAYDGEHALAAAIGLRPKVVLLDLGLPRLDGLAVARRLRQDERFDPAVLIAMSGYAQATDREATREAGFDAHLAKPVELAEVYQVLEAKGAGADREGGLSRT